MKPDWNFDRRVVLHIILVIAFMWLVFCSTSRDFFYLAAYIPAISILPYLALLIIVVSLSLTFASKTGKNFHLLGSLTIAVYLFFTSLVVWKRGFESGYTVSEVSGLLLCLSSCVGFATAVSWFVRRERKTISLRQLAGCTLFVSLLLAATQQLLRFDKIPSYQLEIDAVRELERIGVHVTWDDWSVSGLAIRNAGIQDEQLVRICEFPNLRSLSLEGNPITDTTIKSIANVHRLHGVYLDDTKVGDDGIKHLSNAVNLEQLWLRGTNVTDSGLAYLENLALLGYVDLSNTSVSDKGLEKITHLKRMYYLHLPGTSVTRSGMDSLGEQLSNCTIYGTPGGVPYTVERHPR